MGAIFISLLTLFFIGFLFISMKNFNSEMSLIDSISAQIKTISETERSLIQAWIKENQIQIPEGRGYRYIIQTYPSKPWLKQ